MAARSPSPLALAWRTGGAGRVTEHLRRLFTERDRLAAPFLSGLDPVPLPDKAETGAAEAPGPSVPASN